MQLKKIQKSKMKIQIIDGIQIKEIQIVVFKHRIYLIQLLHLFKCIV